MEYTKQNYQGGQKLYASQLNAMDDQIAANAQAIGALEKNITDAGKNIEELKSRVEDNETNVEDMNQFLHGKIVENTFSETYECTEGTSVSGDLRFFDLCIAEGTQYTFSAQADGIFGGNVALYEVFSDNSKSMVGYLREADGWSITASATREVRSFALYAASDRITGSGTITLNVIFSADTINSVEKRMAEVEKGVVDAQEDIKALNEQTDELSAIINGTEYTKSFSGKAALTAGKSPSGATVIVLADIEAGRQYSMKLDCEGIIDGHTTVYEVDAAGNRSTAGVLKSEIGYSLSAIAKSDIAGFSIYTDGTNVKTSGEVKLTISTTIEAAESLTAQVSTISDAVHKVVREAMRGSSVMGYRTVYYSDCLEIGATVNNDNNATYVFHNIDFDIDNNECVGVRVGSVENATSAIIGYILGSVDGTEYTNLFSFKSAGVYHVYPPLEYTKLRVRFYPSTSGGLDEVTAKFRDVEIFTSNDGRRRLANEYAPRTWDVPGYYLRDGYMDGKVDEILNRVDASGGDCDVFFFSTDNHWRFNTGVSPALVGYLSRRLNIQRLFFGGDWADGYTENGILAFKEAFNGKIYSALGNHDYMNYWCRLGENENEVTAKELTPAMATFQLISRIDDIVLGSTETGYYYVDNPTNKMRYIVLQVFTDESAVNLQDDQLTWLDGVLAGMPEGYLAVVFAHYLAAVGDDGTTTLYAPTGERIAEVCDRYAAKVSCMFSGHTHRDGTAKTDGGIPMFVTSCDSWSLAGLQEDTDNPRVPGTRTEQVVEVIIVDRTNHKVSAVRIGCPAREGTDTSVEVREQTFVS